MFMKNKNLHFTRYIKKCAYLKIFPEINVKSKFLRIFYFTFLQEYMCVQTARRALVRHIGAGV